MCILLRVDLRIDLRIDMGIRLWLFHNRRLRRSSFLGRLFGRGSRRGSLLCAAIVSARARFFGGSRWCCLCLLGIRAGRVCIPTHIRYTALDAVGRGDGENKVSAYCVAIIIPVTRAKQTVSSYDCEDLTSRAPSLQTVVTDFRQRSELTIAYMALPLRRAYGSVCKRCTPS